MQYVDMIRQLRNIALFSIGVLSLSSCGMIGALIIATSNNAKITINDRFVKSSRGLTNGIRFEKMTVLDRDENGIPTEYIVTQRFECYNPGVEGEQNYWPKKIYFHKLNGHYKWRSDTVSFHYKRTGKYRERILPDTIDLSFNFKGQNDSLPKNEKGHLNDVFIFKSISHDSCPVDIESETWYYVNFYDPVLTSVYVYVDGKKQFHTYTFGSGVSPI